MFVLNKDMLQTFYFLRHTGAPLLLSETKFFIDRFSLVSSKSGMNKFFLYFCIFKKIASFFVRHLSYHVT